MADSVAGLLNFALDVRVSRIVHDLGHAAAAQLRDDATDEQIGAGIRRAWWSMVARDPEAADELLRRTQGRGLIPPRPQEAACDI